MFVVVVVLFGLCVLFLHVVVGVVVVILFGAAFALLSYAVAFMLKSEDALVLLLNGLVVLLLLLLGILLFMLLVFMWLCCLLDVNLVVYVVIGVRALFVLYGWVSTVVWGVGVVVVMIVLGLLFGVCTFCRELS